MPAPSPPSLKSSIEYFAMSVGIGRLTNQALTDCGYRLGFTGRTGAAMNDFKGFALIFVGTAWGLLWITIFASIPDHYFYDDTRLVQGTVFLVMSLCILPFGFGINRLIK